MIKFYLFIFGGFLIFRIFYYRFIFTRIPFDIHDISDYRAIIYLILAFIFALSLLSIYYHFFRIFVLKKPINENSRLFKIKLFFNEMMEKYGPDTAFKTFFTYFSKIIPLPYGSIIWYFMRLFAKNKFANYKYYFHVLFLIFVGFPRFIVATMFVIDVCYYEHVELFYKWSLLLGIPLIFNAILGILKLYFESNKRFYHNAVVEMVTIENGKEERSIYYSDPEYLEKYVGPIETFLEIYILIGAFMLAYTKLETVRDKYFFISIYTMHCYLIGWIYILYFYW